MKKKPIFLPSKCQHTACHTHKSSPWHSASMGSYSLEEELSWAASRLSSTDSVFNHTSFTQPQEITHEQGDNYQEGKSIPQSTLPSGSKLMLFKYISG